MLLAMGPANKILVVTTGDPPAEVQLAAGSFADMIRRAIGSSWSGPIVDVDARTGGLPPMPAQGCALTRGPVDVPAAVVISGSPASVYEREPWMVRTEPWLRALLATHVPVLGICFGHQLLAQALGGRVAPNPRGREVGTKFIERLAPDPLFDGVAARFVANCFHDDTVSVVPAAAEVLARSSLDEHHCLRFDQAAYGVQFHPEFDAHVMRSYILARAASLRAQGQSPEQLLAGVQDAVAGQRVLRNFIRRCASRAG